MTNEEYIQQNIEHQAELKEKQRLSDEQLAIMGNLILDELKRLKHV